jgi:hypothetical protein
MSTHTTLLEYVPHLRAELAAFVALWSQPNGGIDTEHGGFCCGLDYNGTRLVGNKYVWFNGRGIWVWSCCAHRAVARAALGEADAVVGEEGHSSAAALREVRILAHGERELGGGRRGIARRILPHDRAERRQIGRAHV